MRYAILFVLSILFVFSCGEKMSLEKLNAAIERKRVEQKAIVHKYIYTLARYNNSEQISELYCSNIIRYAEKYSIDPLIIARQIWRESGFNNRAVNGKSYGCSQIQRWHDKLFRLAEQYNRSVYVKEQYFWIGTSVEVQCMLIRYFSDIYGDIPSAVLAYRFGPNSPHLKRYLKKQDSWEKYDYCKTVLKAGYLEQKEDFQR